MSALYTACVFCHVLAACGWVGSMMFFALVVAPILRRPELGTTAPAFIRQIGPPFRLFGYGCLGVLLVTGALNLVFRGVDLETLGSAAFWADGFGRALAHKLAAVAVVLGLTAGHDALSGRPSSRRLASWLGRLTLVGSAVVVLLAVWLVRGGP